ncbi:hypothetical protein E1265_00350 [Streptomyces sp. 8K308]|uniref:DUF6531 domain-containing protein n=1 Tax=Streptomyces sp. 8K308 TaxID=2530388 RepID=UPI0010447783|nr:DUF6531 domain-containing protein [Streptomyces sp. 8K308]TDC28023.1 hypothetical protein E1265_00350 [Streptomyces sp. 8K308]
MARPSDWSPVDMDFDPTPGNPDEVRQLADELQTFADDVGEALTRVRGMAGDRAVQDWAGLSAQAFRSEFDGVPGNLEKLQTSYDMAARALQSYWPKLETAQGMADRALDRAIAAQADLSSAQAALTDAQDWVSLAGEEAERLEREGEREGVEPPSEAEVRAATRDANAANEAASSAQGRVDAAAEALSAARELARQAKELREDAARTCASEIDAASDAGIQNRRWWEDAVHWVQENWDTIVEVCKVVVAVLGIVVMIIGGPLAWVVLAAALVVLADTLYRYANGEASLWDVAFAALDCVPGMRGLTTLGGLAAGVRALARTGLRGMARGAVGAGRRLRGNAVEFGRRVLSRDPVDFATGAVAMPETDVDLPGVLPLILQRHHLSTYTHGRCFGSSWASTLDQRLVLEEGGVLFRTADGMILEYPVPLSDPEIPVLPVEGPRWGLAWGGQPGGPLTVHQPESGRTLHFAAQAGATDGELPLIAVTDRNDNRIDIRRGADGLPSEVAHSGGYRIAVATYEGRVTALRLLNDPDEPVIRAFRYDEAGNLSEVYDSSGTPLRYEYDERSRMTRWVDRNGHWYRYAYDETGRCVLGTGSDRCLEYHYRYGPEDHRTVVTDSLGNDTVYQFNDSFQLVARTDPLGNTTTHEWDRYDCPLAVSDPLGRRTRFEYDGRGRLAAVVRPDGASIRTEYDDLGLLTEVTEADGSVWRQAYDGNGNCAVLVDPSGNRTYYTYDSHGGLTAVTDALGNVTRIRTDAAGLALEVVDSHGQATRCHRDAFGRPVRVIDPRGAETRECWSTEGRLVRRVHPQGGEETWEWDAEGNLLTHTDANGQTTHHTYGPFGQLTSRTGADGARYAFTRDTELNLCRVTDPAARTWDYTFDAAGRVVAESDFDNRTTRLEYDAAGQVVARVNGAGESVGYSYDILGHLVRVTTSDGGTTSYSFDPQGRVTRATGPGAVVERSYDLLGNLLSETVNGRRLTLTYDANWRVTSRETPSGHVSRWAYDTEGACTSLTTGRHRLAFEHDVTGRETGRRIGERLFLAQNWDMDGRLSGQTLTTSAIDHERVVHRRAYAYRPDGYLSGITDQAGTTAFTLDAVGRVTAVTSPAGTESYAYDPVGNQAEARWSLAGTPDETSGDRAYQGTLLTRAGQVSYAYDRAGRVVLRRRRRLSHKPDTWHYTWDAQDRLIEVRTPDQTTWRYVYDPFGRRIAKERVDADGSVAERIDFTWWLTSLVEQRAVSSERAGLAETTTWDHIGHLPVAQTEARSAPPAGGIRREAEREEFDRRFYAIITDLIGTPTHLVTEGGKVAWQGRTTLWGIPVAEARGTASTPLRFPGQYADEESGWHYNYHRHYDPATARYISPDPLGLDPAPNHYGYPPNPFGWTDILGLYPASGGSLNWNWRSRPTFGHTFSTHGAGPRNTRSLTDRARSTGNDQGQWLDNDAAADFLRSAYDPAAGPRRVRIPDGLGQVIRPDGSIVQAQWANLVPGRNGGYRTAYPIAP